MKHVTLMDIYPWAVIQKKWNWAARDKDNCIHLFENEPVCGKNIWESSSGEFRRFIPDVIYGYVKGETSWENSLVRRK